MEKNSMVYKEINMRLTYSQKDYSHQILIPYRMTPSNFTLWLRIAYKIILALLYPRNQSY